MAVGAILIPLLISTAATGASYLLRPKIRQEPVDIGKAGRIDITGSEFGTPIIQGWGSFRNGGNIIFATGRDEHIINTPSTGGGKGGGGSPSPATRTYIYTTTLMIQFSRGEIDRFGRIWANEAIIANNAQPITEVGFEAEDASLSGGASAYADAPASGGNAVQNIGSGGYVTFDTSGVPLPSDLTEPPDPEELPEPYTTIEFFYKSNADKTVSLLLDGAISSNVFLPSSNNEWSVVSKNFEGHLNSVRYGTAGSPDPNLDRISVLKYVINIRILPREIESYKGNISGFVNPDIAYPTDLDDPSGYYNYKPTKDAQGETVTSSAIGQYSVRTYTGTETQTQDPAIVSSFDSRFGAGEGILRTSANRGMVCLMLENRQLPGGSLENYTAEMIEGTTDAQAVIEAIYATIPNLSPADYDASAAAGKTQVGFIDHTPQSRNQLVNYLLRWHHLRHGEIDGVIKVIDMNIASSYTIDADNLRAYEYGNEPPTQDAIVTKKEAYLAPKQVVVSFLDKRLDYRNNDAPSLTLFSESGTEIKQMSFPVVASFDEATQRANVIHAQEVRENKVFDFTHLPTGGFSLTSIGDKVTIPIGGRNYPIRVEKITRQIPVGVINVEGVRSSQTIFNNFGTGIQNDMPPILPKQNPPPVYPANSQAIVIQSAPVHESDFGKIGIYAAVSRRGRGAWTNAQLFIEVEADNWETLSDPFNTPAPIGITQGLLKQTTNEAVDVWFFEDIHLESFNIAPLTPYQNLFYIGVLGAAGAWRQFTTANGLSLTPPSTYRSAFNITDLEWAGLFGTESVPLNHVSGSFVTVYRPGALRFIELPPQLIGQTVRIRAVTAGQNINNAIITEFVFSPFLSNAPVASENLFEGAWVNVYDDGGTTKVRLADASNADKFANGFVLEAYATSDQVYIREIGEMNYKSVGSVAGTNWLSAATPGQATPTAPSGAGHIVQILGNATAAKYIKFAPSMPYKKS